MLYVLQIKKNIRENIDNNFEGHSLHVTKWGDSLSDFVQFYDLRELAYPYYPHYSI